MPVLGRARLPLQLHSCVLQVQRRSVISAAFSHRTPHTQRSRREKNSTSQGRFFRERPATESGSVRAPFALSQTVRRLREGYCSMYGPYISSGTRPVILIAFERISLSCCSSPLRPLVKAASLQIVPQQGEHLIAPRVLDSLLRELEAQILERRHHRHKVRARAVHVHPCGGTVE